MRYRLRLLTGAGRTLGTIPFDSSDDDDAIATAARHATEGPLELWAQRDDASRKLLSTDELTELGSQMKRRKQETLASATG
jgi:hypothetical protein